VLADDAAPPRSAELDHGHVNSEPPTLAQASEENATRPIVSAGEDVSHPIDLVRALAASQERLFELLERVPFGVVGTDGKAPCANRWAREILGDGADYALPPVIRALTGETVLPRRVE